jgi:hypothetical protein
MLDLTTVLWQNLGYNALRVLGIRQYFTLIYSFVVKISPIIKNGNLNPLDELFSKLNPIVKIKFRTYNFKVDLKTTDELSAEGSYTFGLIRELYIKNCYLKFYGGDISKITTVVDLGGNRGVFSLLACNFAQTVVMVEPQPKYEKIVRHNLALNNFSNLKFIGKYIGQNGSLDARQFDKTNLSSLIKDASIEEITFLKVDIEGAEFNLFSNPELQKIRYVAMEIHPQFGDTAGLIDRLQANGFQTKLTKMNFRITNASEKEELMYLYGTNLHN